MASVNKKWYPTRLVEWTSNDTFRIIRSDSISQPSQGYITLSHRWGSTDLIKLTTDNLSALERGLPVTILPKTFREALIAAQRLNIRHVWIDSLCIIQSGDNGADWQREATEMTNVYTNSFCNLSADYGNNETDGLIFERTPAFEPACAVRIRCEVPETVDDEYYPHKSSTELLEVRNGCLCHIMRPDGWFEGVLESPLNRRAWVLQERLLAPRVLHFLPGQVSWECGQELAWEKARSGRVAREMDSFDDIRIAMKRFSFDGPLSYDKHFWLQVVQRYSRCGLTKQSDRLVAISGVARRMTSFAKDQYVAGLWASSMPLALGWKIAPYNYYRRRALEEGIPQPSTGYYAPSFSWAAATDGPVWYLLPGGPAENAGLVTAFIKHREKPLYSAIAKTGRPKLDAQILTDHVFGPLTSPVVEVQARGTLRTCHRIPQELVPEYLRDGYRSNECHFAPSKGANDTAVHTCFERGITMEVLFDRHGDVKDAEANDSTYYFTIYHWRYSRQSDEFRVTAQLIQEEEIARGLLLKSVDPSMGRFKRVGHIRVERDFKVVPSSVSDIGVRLGNESGLPASSYDETTGEHVFYIV